MKSIFYKMKSFMLTMMAVVLTVGLAYSQTEVLTLEEAIAIQSEIAQHGPSTVVPTVPEGGSRAIGDDCVTPIVISAYPFSDVNTTAGRGNTYSETCMGSYDGGEDIIYQFTLTETRNVVITMNPGTTTWTGLGLMNACPQTGTCLGIATGAGATPRVISQQLTAGTYYIMVDTYPSPNNIPSFTLDVTAVIPPLPLAAIYNAPANGAIGMPLNVSLNWSANTTPGAGVPTGYKVYMGTDNPPTNIANGTDVGNVLLYTPAAALAVNTLHYWQIVPYNAQGDALNNPVYSFTTLAGFGDLEGFVTNGFGIPVAGATVNITDGVNNYTTTSAANGAYSFALAAASNYTLTASLASYNNTVLPVTISANTTTYQNVVLTRPSMAVTPNPYSVSVNPNEMVDGALNIANNGDGILGYTATVNYTSPGPNTWLTLGQTTGTVNPYSNFNLPVAFNATGLTSGTVKTAEITLTSTPNVGTVVIPVTMSVNGIALNAPADFTATLTNPVSGIVSLSWSFTTAPSFQFFVIKRDGVQVGTTTGTSFTNTLPGYGVYSYTVQAVFAEGNSAPAGPATIEWSNPVLVLAPTSLYNEQYPVTSEPVTFRISNTGEGTLAYSFPEYATRQLVNSPDFTPNVRSTVKEVEVAKGEVDPTDGMGNRNLRGAGGPDAFGYVWIDSDETGGPAYQWVDISATGTAITGFTDDNVLGPFPIGFSFPFYENYYTEVAVSSNGYLVFGNTASAYSNQNIPSSTTPNNILAWFWNDLTGGGNVRYQNMGDRWIIQFNNYPDLSGTGTITAQVHLFPTGHIRIYYNTISSGFNITSSTIGIENNAGTVATNINYNAAYVHNGLAVAIDFPIPTFITAVNPAQGQVAPGEFVDVTATFTSDDINFPVGTYTAELELNTNDLANAVVMIPSTMVVYEPGMISGTVTSAVDGSPIFGANVVAGAYSTMTDEAGNYSFVADAGTYSITFSKTGFTSETVTGVVVTETETTVVDAELEEVIYPATLVHAVVDAADLTTDVTWGAPNPDYEVLYDDGTAENYTAWALPGNMNAVKFTPAGYPATVYGGKIYVGDGSFPNNNTGFLGTTFGAMVMDDSGANGMPGVVIDSVEVTVNNYGWVVFSGLDATIEEGSFYLVMIQGGTSPNVAGVGVDQTTPTSYRSYSRNVVAGQPWGLSPYQDLMIRALVNGPASDDNARVAASTEVRTPLKQRGMISLTPATAQSGAEGEAQYLAVQGNQGSRDVTSYKVWRIAVANPDLGPESGVQTLLNATVATTNYTDAAFGPLPEGWYAYAVAANYTNGGESVKAYSNIVGHKKLVDVTVNVSLTTGGNPAGAVVSLTGLDYPYSVLTQTVPENGTVVFTDTWKGNYTILAKKVGFDDYVISANIQSDRTFNIILAERKYKPRNLYVDALTLEATWDEPLAVAVLEDFEGSTFPPTGWSTYTQNTNGWFASTNGASGYFPIPAHTKYAVTNDDAANGDGCCDYLMTPVMDWTDLPSYRLNFASFFTAEYGQSAYVEISTDNGASWTIINTLAGAPGAWQNIEIDLAAYSGASGLGAVKVAFHADDNGEWASGWAIDDVQIASGGVPMQGYGVFLDGSLVGNTPERTWTYTNLNYGQTYLAGVAALFSSGYSELDTYRFTSVYLIPPTDLAGISPELTDYVQLTWVAPTVPTVVRGPQSDIPSAAAESDQNAEPRNIAPSRVIWDVLYNFDMDGPSGLTGLAGAESDGEFIYAPAWASGSITKFDVDGNFIENFTIPGVSGLRDLAFDGTYMYGAAAATTVWKMDFTTKTLVSSFTAPTAVRAIAYDSEQDAFWANNWDTDMILFDETGTQLDALSGMPSLYGVAYDNFTADGPYLWFFTGTTSGGGCQVEQYSLPNEALTGVAHSVSGDFGSGYIAGGLYVSTSIVPGKVVLGGTAQGTPDLAFGYEIGEGGGPGPSVANLLGYNIYRDDAMVAFVEKPALEYFDLDLAPATYSYHITAVYDLTPYGFAGQTGESMIEGPIDVEVIYGYELPFMEDFTTGVFETNQWVVNGGNWQIAGQAGNPAPAAEFTYAPVVTGYEQSIESAYLIGAGMIDGSIKLDFDLKHTLINASETETLSVEVNNGSGWVQVAQYKNTANFDWETKNLDITSRAKDHVFQIRFVARGENTTNINNWLVDNVHVYRLCEAPTELVASLPAPTTHGDQILLEWVAPNAPTPGPSGWLFWDNGTNVDAIGLTGGGTFNVAVRFTPAQLAEYAGTSLTKIRMFAYGPGGTLVLKVWTGANASQLVMSQPIASYTAGAWNEWTLDTPVMVSGTTELWFGYAVTHGTDYVAGCDGGPAVAGYGDMISLDGSVWESMSQAYALNYNWNLQGYVEAVDGVSTQLQPINDNTVYGPVSELVRGNYPMLSGASLPVESMNASRELTGYNIYRDEVLIGNTTETSYLDTDPAISVLGQTYCYNVTAVYEDCESAFSNTACETVIAADNIEVSAVNVYPNPSNSVVNIELTNDISQLVIYNYVGQVVYEQVVAKDMNIQIDVRNYDAGAYLVKFITRSGESFTKKIAVTK